MANLFVLPPVDASQKVRLDTAPDTDSAATVTFPDGTAVAGALLTADEDGTLPRVTATEATLYLKRLTYHGDVTGTPIAVVGSDQTPGAGGGGSGVSSQARNSWLWTDPATFSDPLDFSDHNIVGTDLAVGLDNQTINFLADGLYQVSAAVVASTDATGGAVDFQVHPVFLGFTAPEDGVLDWANQHRAVLIDQRITVAQGVAWPATKFKTGDSITMSATATGTVTPAVIEVYVTRLA